MRKFINIADINKKDLRFIIDNAKLRKEKRSDLNKNSIDTDVPLKGKILIMIFEKPSTRTRISFDLAVKQLGGKSLILNPDEIHYGTGNESIYDTAKVLSQYADIVMLRTHAHKNIVEFSKYLDVPLINGLTDLSHPCQIMSDIMTFEELKGPIANKKIAWLGDGNNIVYSLIEASVQFNFELSIACPKDYEPNKKIITEIRSIKKNVLIIGASSGIGNDLLRLFLQNKKIKIFATFLNNSININQKNLIKKKIDIKKDLEILNRIIIKNQPIMVYYFPTPKIYNQTKNRELIELYNDFYVICFRLRNMSKIIT